MLRHILPPAVAVSESYSERRDITLFPDETRFIARATAKRRDEFSTVRACAREALGTLGVPVQPLVPGTGGVPSWPDEVVGSMTHCVGFRAVAVARRAEFDGVGIDAEPNRTLSTEALEAVATVDEVAQLRLQQANSPSVALDCVLFCAKEAVYKAWFPLHYQYVAHQDIVVHLDGTQFRAHVRPAGGGPAVAFHGRWFAAHGLVCAASAMPKGSLKAKSLALRRSSLPLFKPR